MNLRPPGPQPGALPDCATPRGFRPTERATGIEPALKAWKAFVQPQHFARSGRRHRTAAAVHGQRGAARLCGDLSLLARQARRRPGAEPVVARGVERDDRVGEGVAERRGGERDEPGVLLLAAEALERDGARRSAPDGPARTTSASHAASSAAAAVPSPEPPPVTNATRPSSIPGARTSERHGGGV